MDVETLLVGSKWELLEALAEKPQSTSELAAALRTSQANVSQQLRQLELAGMVERVRTARKGVHYSWLIKEPFLYIAYLDKSTALKESFAADAFDRFLAGLLLTKHRRAFLSLFCGQPEFVRKLKAIGVLDRHTPEIFVLAEDVEAVRKQHASIGVKTLGGEESITVWSHTQPEVLDGIERNEPYFLQALDEISLLYDPEQELGACLARRNPA